MTIKIYQIDAFTDEIFKGNPAAVCPLETWLPDEILLKIASENNLSETAFYVEKEDYFEIRWFTPTVEVDLCGHATLATAFVLKNFEGFDGNQLSFYSLRSGNLSVTFKDDLLILNFPTDIFSEIELTKELFSVTNYSPIAAYKGKTDYMLIYENESEISEAVPDLQLISKLDARGAIITSKGKDYDFVSRFFAPASGVNEDPVCGSAHTTLVPYWAQQFGKKELKAFQNSQRTGEIFCQLIDDRVELGGKAVLYMKGEIAINF